MLLTRITSALKKSSLILTQDALNSSMEDVLNARSASTSAQMEIVKSSPLLVAASILRLKSARAVTPATHSPYSQNALRTLKVLEILAAINSRTDYA